MNLTILKSSDGENFRAVNIYIEDVKSLNFKTGLGVYIKAEHHHEKGVSQAFDVFMVEFLSVVTFTIDSIDQREYTALVASVIGPYGLIHVVVDQIGSGLLGQHQGELFNYQSSKDTDSLYMKKRPSSFSDYLDGVITGDYQTRFVKHKGRLCPEEMFEALIDKE